MELNCIIIDDEPLARKGIREYIHDVPFLNCCGEFDQALDASDLIASGTIHIVFLDIQMPRVSGLDFLRSLQHPPPVIFTTAYPQYALEGFDLNALDYLVKPVSFDRFLKAAMKAKEYHELRQQNRSADSAGTEGHFFIKSDNKLVRILYDEVLFVEALQNYVNIHTKDHKYITYLTFKSVEEYLPSPRFIKTHKSYIVSSAKVDSIEGNDVRIGNAMHFTNFPTCSGTSSMNAMEKKYLLKKK